MILYTPLSEHDIFPSNQEEQVVYQQYKNCPVKCKETSDGKRQIIQVLSTNPDDYINPSLQPGQWLDS